MAKKLDRYRGKRDPARTNEPFGAEPLRRKTATRAGRYVVHLHDATRRHYDLRLEVGGVLLSFAVPRGPTLDPGEKRLAVLTENHPLDYLDFEAVIPEGNYGAGPMILWDTGVVRYLESSAESGLDAGKVDFVLEGFKLRGRFALVETARRARAGSDPRSWLLIKKADAFAKPGHDITQAQPRSVLSGLDVGELAHPHDIAEAVATRARALGARSPLPHAAKLFPMRCAESGAKLEDHKSLYELKLDGVRILAERNQEHATLRYRTQRIATTHYPEITQALRALPFDSLILDGEIISLDERGRPSFARLARRVHAHGAHDVRRVMREAPVLYLVFDLLAVGDLDLRKLPLHERKALLREVVRGDGFIRVLDHVDGDGRALLAFCKEQGLEGLVVKRADSPYVSRPERSTYWSKLKLVREDDFVVVGFTHGRGSRRALGALELASYVGDTLIARGRVGSGLAASTIDELRKALSALVVPHCMAQGELLPAPGGESFVHPRLVVRVQHAGFTPDGRLRHPIYRGVRADVAPEACTVASIDEHEGAALREAAANSHTPKRSQPSRIALTNRDKIFWPADGITKGELCDYYASVAGALLPYLRDRPVLMVRYPDGIEGKHFYQWNAPSGAPDFVHLQSIHSEEHRRDIAFVRIEDLDTLLYVANLGCIPLHMLASRFDDLERCDFLTIDFDLGTAPFSAAITLARTLHELLEELGLPGFPKTSGQTGLHVLVPLGGVPFEAAKTLATLLGQLVHARRPELSTLERRRERRKPGVVYIDTGQTGRSRAIVAPYSVRAHPGATVSTPLRWDEVGPALAPARFDLFTVPDRLAEIGDPMRPVLDVQPDLAEAVTRLGQLVTRAPRRKR